MVIRGRNVSCLLVMVVEVIGADEDDNGLHLESRNALPSLCDPPKKIHSPIACRERQVPG